MRNRTEAQVLRSRAMHEHDLEKREELLLNAEELSQTNPIDLHFTYIQLAELYYKQRNDRKNAVDLCIEVCIKDIDLYPRFKKAYIDYEIGILKQSLNFTSKGSEEHNRKINMINDYKYTPPSIPSFKRLAIIYEQQQRFEEAIVICGLALRYGLHDETKSGFEGRIEKLKRKIKNPPQPRQPTEETIKRNRMIKQNSIAVAQNKKDNLFKGFMITFSKSNSSNFNRALYLAKQSDKFDEVVFNEQTIYQASFKPENHLQFIALYELVQNWKSTFVFKDGELIDRKVIGQINYCYGDKLRFGDNSFCNGASYMTQNPFGCHRLMVHDGHKPWHTWIRGEDKRFIYIDKTALREHIDKKSKTLNYCPAFDYDKVIGILNEIPNKIDKNSKFYKERFNSKYTEVVTISINNSEGNPRQGKPKGLLARLVGLISNNTKKGR